MADDLGGNPFDIERSEEDKLLQEYIEEYGFSAGLALFREDFGLELDSSDVEALQSVEWGDGGNGVEDIDDVYPDADDVIPDATDYDPSEWDPLVRDDDALGYAPVGDNFDIETVEYYIYLNDGSIRHGYIDIYHEDTDIEDAIWAANEDIDYSDAVGVSY